MNSLFLWFIYTIATKKKHLQKDPAASIVVIADVAIDLQVPFQIGETCRAEISTEKKW